MLWLYIVKVQLYISLKLFNGRSPAGKDDAAHLQMRGASEERTATVTQGKYVECIDIMEEIVSIKKSVYGIDHP